MKKERIKISAWDFNPTDNYITADLVGFLEELFKAGQIVYLEENQKEYTAELVEELANDILVIREEGQ